MTITAAADGSALGNPGPAGWAWYIDDDTWRAGGWPHGTNNMGELKAVLDLLESTADAGRADEDLLVLCDSQYVINSVTKWMPGWKKKGWKKRDGKPVLNVDLMKAIDAAMQGRRVRFEWVKGHAGHPMNEAADQRANAAATAFQKKQAPQEGPGFDGASSPAPAAATGVASTADAVVDRELALLSDAVRGDRELASRLLHEGMTEISATGQRHLMWSSSPTRPPGSPVPSPGVPSGSGRVNSGHCATTRQLPPNADRGPISVNGSHRKRTTLSAGGLRAILHCVQECTRCTTDSRD